MPTQAAATPAEAGASALDAVFAGFPEPAERTLRRFFARYPAFGRRDRLRITDAVFDVLRHRRLLAAVVQARGLDPGDARALVDVRDEARRRIEGSAAPSSADASAGTAADLIGLVQADLGPLPEPVRYSLPDWLWNAFVASHGDEADALALALLDAAPLDLRVNLIRARPETVVSALAAIGVPATPIAGVAGGLRVPGRPPLETLDAWARGAFEVQDAGSQRLVELCAPRKGQVVVDFCAGAGGKALAIASRMRNIGQVYAFDTVESRLASLRERAGRAGATIIHPVRIAGEDDPRLERYEGRADLVFVDAPCSGTGTLRRHPDLKWRLAEGDVAGYVDMQRRILRAASRLVRSGGTLAYATCSVLNDENVAQRDSFNIENEANSMEMPASDGRNGIIDGQWLPGRDDSDGFFVSRWSREANGHYNCMVTHRVTKGVAP